jgi:cytochrome c oxidase subunit 1
MEKHSSEALSARPRTTWFSRDHRAVARLYFVLALVAVLLGQTLSLIMRFHLVKPQAKVGWFEALWPTGAPSGVMTPELYLSIMTLHGTIMVFFVLTTAPMGTFANLVLPEQLGATRMAYPRLNALSFWTIAAAFVVLIASFVGPGGGPLAGWTAYPPLSAIGAITGPGEGLGQTLWLISIAIFCVGSVLSAINIIATVIDMRAPEIGLMDMPITCWNWFVTAILSLLSFSVLLPAGVLLLFDRVAGTSFFVPDGLRVGDMIVQGGGGSPLFCQHLFWFFGHPEVYMAILPGFGAISVILSVFSRKPVFGYKAMVTATVAIAILGMLVWGHHMFTSGLNPYSSLAFSLLTIAVAVPSSVKTFNWIATLWGGQIELTSPMLYALGFISVFVTGGLSGIVLGQPGLDQYFHDTYFVVAHFHIIMGVASIFTIFAATAYWFPILFGRMMNETLGKLHFYLTFIGVYAIFLPMHFVGFAGNPRRYADFTTFDFLNALMPLHKGITHAAYFTAAVQLLFVGNLIWSAWKGPVAPKNPWGSQDREWT